MQIDGLSRAALDQGLRDGRMPVLAHLLDRHAYRLEPMSVGLPTSTPAFQMAAMYGVRPDIPGFHYYHRGRRADIHFPRPGHAAMIEAEQAAGRRGILHGGSAYGCVFTGGAENDLWSFARLSRPTGRGLLCVLSASVVVAWVFVKCLVRTVFEIAKALGRLVAHPVAARRGWRWLTIKLGLSIWLRGFFTLAVSRDLYAGTPAVYVNYLDYDVAAHAFGPRSRRAMRALSLVDRSLHHLWRVLRRVPEHRYDLYILSDHGQAPSTPYRELSGGQPLERRIFDQFLSLRPERTAAASGRAGLASGIRRRLRGSSGFFQHFLNYLDEDFLRRRDPEAHEQNGIRVISAGPNAFLYVLDRATPLDVEALEHRFPGLPADLSNGVGVGFVLARAVGGPVCFSRGKRYQLGPSDPGPFTDRPDAALVVQGIRDLMAMPSAGDLVLYGTGAPGGAVSFVDERGAHAGPSEEELHAFILHEPGARLPAGALTHPRQLYPHFLAYREVKTEAGGETATSRPPACVAR